MKKESAITGDILKSIAKVFFNKLSQYYDELQPRFSTGQLDGFKVRYKIKKYLRYGDAEAVDRVIIKVELSELRQDIQTFDVEDIFNIDKIELFQKASSNGTLTTQ